MKNEYEYWPGHVGCWKHHVRHVHNSSDSTDSLILLILQVLERPAAWRALHLHMNSWIYTYELPKHCYARKKIRKHIKKQSVHSRIRMVASCVFSHGWCKHQQLLLSGMRRWVLLVNWRVAWTWYVGYDLVELTEWLGSHSSPPSGRSPYVCTYVEMLYSTIHTCPI